jgi:hypothetical protein
MRMLTRRAVRAEFLVAELTLLPVKEGGGGDGDDGGDDGGDGGDDGGDGGDGGGVSKVQMFPS